MLRGHDPFSPRFSLFGNGSPYGARNRALPRWTFIFSLFSVSFSLRVAFTISLVNICFHASMCREVDPRCVMEGSTFTCPYVSKRRDSKILFCSRIRTVLLLTHFSPAGRIFFELLSNCVSDFAGEPCKRRVCFKSRSKGSFVDFSSRGENVKGFLFHDADSNTATRTPAFYDMIPAFIFLLVNRRRK